MSLSTYVFLVILATVHGQYGPAPPNYQPQPQYQIAPAPMNDNYVCSIQANYGLYGQLGKHFRATTNFCQDTHKGDSCTKCCAMTARIQGTQINEESIIGFQIVLKREPLCICCSPNTVE